MGWRGSAQSFGGVIWPLTGGALGAISWRFPFAVYMLAIPIGLFAIAAVPEPVIQHRTGSQSSGGTSVLAVFRGNPVLFIIYGLIFFGNLLLKSANRIARFFEGPLFAVTGFIARHEKARIIEAAGNVSFDNLIHIAANTADQPDA